MGGKAKSADSVGTTDALAEVGASKGAQSYDPPNLMMRAGFLSLLFVCAAAACTSFGEEPVVPGADAGATDGGGAADAAIDAGGAAPRFDFEDGTYGQQWIAAGVKSPSVQGGDCNEGSKKCLEVKTGDNSTSYLSRALPPGPKVRVVAAMKVVKRGNGEIDMFGFKRGLVDQGGWIVSPSTGPYVVESAIEGPSPKTTRPLTAILDQWTPIEVVLQRGANPSMTWTVGRDAPIAIALPAEFAAGEMVLEVGIRFVLNVTQEWVIRYDDIQVSLPN